MTKPFLQFLFGIFLTGVLCAACQKYEERYASMWEKVDGLMEVSPTDALAALEEIHPDSLPLSDYMRYELLMTQAKDKNYIDHTSDSLINTITAYYDSINAPVALRMKAHYYKARVYHDLDSSFLALQEYMTAYKLANEIEDNDFIALSSTNLGRILVKHKLYHQADDCYKRAQDIIEKGNDSIWLFVIMVNRAYIDMEHGESRFQEAEQKLQTAYVISEKLDTMFRQRVHTAFASLYSMIPDHQKTINWCRSFIDIQPDTTMHPSGYLMMGEAYSNMGQIDSAMYCLRKSAQSSKAEIKYGSYAKLAELARKKGMLEKALNWNDSSHVYYYQMEAARKPTAIISNLKDLVHGEELEHYRNVSLKKQTKVWIFFAIILLISLCISYDYVCTRKKAKLYVKEMERIKSGFKDKNNEISRLNNLLTECEGDKAEVALLKQQIENLKSETTADFNTILPGLSSYRTILSLLEKSDRLKASEENISSKLWKEIEFELDCVTNCFTTRLAKKYPELKIADIHYCCLLKLGFRYKELALLLGRTPRMMYNRRTKISQIINLPDDENLEDFIDHF